MKTAAPKPTVVVDTREQVPLPIADLPMIRGTLATGDYSILGCEHLFSVERKSIADLVGCCCGDSRARFERELHRLRGYRFKRLLVVGVPAEIATGRYRSGISPAAVQGTLAAFEVRYDCPVVFEPDPQAAATLVCRWAWYFARELFKTTQAMTPTPAPATPLSWPPPEADTQPKDPNAPEPKAATTN